MKSRFRLLPRTLAGRIVLLVLAAVFLSQLASLGFMVEERGKAIRTAARVQIVERTVSVVNLLEQTPVDLHDGVLSAASTKQLRLWKSPEPQILSPDERATTNRMAAWGENRLAGYMRRLLGDSNRDIRVQARNQPMAFPWFKARKYNRDRDEHEDESAEDGWDDHHGKYWHGRPRFHRMLAFNLSVPLASGGWLNAASDLKIPSIPWGESILWAMVVAVVLCLIAVLMIRRITGPLKNLAAATESVGRGEKVPPLDETGPEDIRDSIRAFNAMQDRLTRFVSDRTRLLAAMSHDLRTPITTLRLRAEFIEDEETQTKILATLADMQSMAEATLDFVREEASDEDTRTVELSALISSLCDDMAQSGSDVSFQTDIKIDYACRSVALKRAISNLISNAINYGGYARVELAVSNQEVLIRVSDGGPGIAVDQLEQVFQPFFRLEVSRNRDTGGIGLGLSIARSVIRSHGGDLVLENRTEKGLLAQIQLPR